MNCVIPGPNLKVLGKAVHALAKIGDEIYLEANDDHISLRTVSISTTVFAFVKFLNPFFTHYKLVDVETASVTSSQGGISCKMPTKALLSVFKSPNQMERQVEVCKIELDPNPTKITFKFRYKNDVNKTQIVWLIDGDESLQIALFNDITSNKIAAGSAIYTQALANFQLTDGEVTIDVNPQKIIMRNYIEGEQRTNHVRSKLSLSPSEFSMFSINKNAVITFALRPFRAAITFAESFNMGIALIFEQPGKPMKINITNNVTFEANFILATMNQDGGSQSTTTESIIVPTDQQNITKINDKSQLSENWEGLKLTEDHTEVKDATMAKDNKIADDKIDNKMADAMDEDMTIDLTDEPSEIPNSPESPRSKRLKLIFKRCFESTFRAQNTAEEILAENSDPECEALM